MGLLDWIYGKDRPAAVTAAETDARMRALAEETNRKVAQLEAAEKYRRSLTAKANTRK